ncbi:MAG: hypothetical protein KDD44_15025, partial [Bdellovibrionales bacterium]|nr:hypothetical protein [Bdellovibrionales bacterium]
MSVILGLNTSHAGSSAALIVDGRIVAAIAEERLNRVKYYAGFPRLAVAECLNIAGLSFADITDVAVGRDSSANLAKKLEYAIKNPRKLLNLAKIQTSRSSLGDLQQLIAAECGVANESLRFRQHNVEHHVA